MEIFSVKQPWSASQPKESTELLLEEIRTIGSGGYGNGGSGGSSNGGSGNGGSGNATKGGSGNATKGSDRGVSTATTARTVDRGSDRYFDLIIHHVALYPYSLQKSIFESLWSRRLNHGGMYVMEGLETTQHTQGGASMIRDIVAWAGSLLYNGRIAGR